MLSILLVSKTGGTYENEKNKSRFEKEKLKSAFFVYVEKIKPFLLLIHKRKSKIKNGFFYCLKGGMQNVEVRNNKKKKFGGKIIWYTMKKSRIMSKK